MSTCFWWKKPVGTSKEESILNLTAPRKLYRTQAGTHKKKHSLTRWNRAKAEELPAVCVIYLSLFFSISFFASSLWSIPVRTRRARETRPYLDADNVNIHWRRGVSRGVEPRALKRLVRSLCSGGARRVRQAAISRALLSAHLWPPDNKHGPDAHTHTLAHTHTHAHHS